MEPMKPMQPMKPMEPMKPMGGGEAWWPKDLGDHPSSSGSSNGVRYAFFAEAKRLAVQRDGGTKLYDTGSHRISGVQSQSSGGDSELRFSDSNGSVRLEDLKEVG